ncbi:hypothetical protein F0726_01886 [Acidithiobacillus caldus]|nr:hypothetical protein F0726_01886 [Acidithiobacillus caldus]
MLHTASAAHGKCCARQVLRTAGAPCMGPN